LVKATTREWGDPECVPKTKIAGKLKPRDSGQ